MIELNVLFHQDAHSGVAYTMKIGQKRHRNLMMISVLLFVMLFSSISFSDEFDDAQLAAKEGRYRDVVRILTGALTRDDLEQSWEIVAYSNRGIAYSLLDAYALADKDLLRAVKLDPAHTLSLNQLGLLAERVKHDATLAASYYKRAVALDFPASEVNLAALYRTGNGVNKSSAKAFKLLKRAARQGYPNAFAILGVMYAKGEGTKVNTKEAFKLYKKGAEFGIAVAYYRLGLAYEKGRGAKVDQKEALRNYRLAAVQGHGEAQSALGYMYRRGRGTTKNLDEAASWYQLAADQDVASANNRLAWLLATCPSEKLCNGEKAELLALNAIAIVKKSQEQASNIDNFNVSSNSMVSMKDSLAAAFARSEKYELAIDVMEKLIASLTKNHRQLSIFKKRLALYQKHKPYQMVSP